MHSQIFQLPDIFIIFDIFQNFTLWTTHPTKIATKKSFKIENMKMLSLWLPTRWQADPEFYDEKLLMITLVIARLFFQNIFHFHCCEIPDCR